MESQILSQRTFDIFLIFIKYQKRDKIIKELEKLKTNGVLYGNMTKLYNDFRQILLPFGEIFNYIITKKINLPKDVKDKILKIRKSFIINITKKSNKIRKTLKHILIQHRKKQSLKKNKSSGGFLFMLEDKGDQPITGKDITNVLDKYDKAIDLLYYTQYGQDSTVTGGEDSEIKHDLANPFTGMATIMALSRKNIPNALMNQIGQIYRALTSLDQLTVASYYYDLYKLYMGAYKRSEEKKNPKAMVLQTLNQGPPKPPSMFENLFKNLINSPIFLNLSSESMFIDFSITDFKCGSNLFEK